MRACIAALFRGKSLPTPRSRYTPRQNAPRTSTGGCPPRKNSPSTAKTLRFGLFSARWAKNVARSTQALEAGRIFSRRPPPTSRAGCPHRYKTLPAHGMHGHNRYKTLPAHGMHGHNRYKTHPAQQKTPISALLTRAGRKLSRSKRKLPEQGELFPADHHTLATQRTPTVQNSPGTPPHRRPPVQNSPSIAKNAHFGPFDASREKIIPVETRSRRKQPMQGEFSPAVVPVPPLHTERGPAKASPVSCSMHPPH